MEDNMTKREFQRIVKKLENSQPFDWKDIDVIKYNGCDEFRVLSPDPKERAQFRVHFEVK
jgi:hypothetical protein